MNFEELIKLNNKKLEEYKNSKDEKKIQLHEKIAELLEKEPALFFKTDMQNCLKILSQILPEDEAREAYKSLISPNEFIRLRNKMMI